MLFAYENRKRMFSNSKPEFVHILSEAFDIHTQVGVILTSY